MNRPVTPSIAYHFSIGLLALAIAPLHSPVRAQSADLVLCDRLAAEPADPDKPADVKGTPVIAPSDIATVVVLVAIWHNPQTLCVNTAIVARATVPA